MKSHEQLLEIVNSRRSTELERDLARSLLALLDAAPLPKSSGPRPFLLGSR